MKYKDYYQILGLPRDASAEDIKKVYRRLARKYHPDVNREAQARHFKAVSEAYEVLRDPEKRAAYQSTGQQLAGRAGFPATRWHGGRTRIPMWVLAASASRISATFLNRSSVGWGDKPGFPGGAAIPTASRLPARIRPYRWRSP